MPAFSLAGYYNTLAMILDCDLLRRYAETKSEDAFAEVVRRHINLVYSTATKRKGEAKILTSSMVASRFTTDFTSAHHKNP